MDDRFIALLLKELSGEISGQELAELHSFVDKSDLYRSQYKFLKKYWAHGQDEKLNDVLSFQKVKSKIDQLSNAPEFSAGLNDKVSNKISLTKFYRIAAALVLFGCFCFVYARYFAKKESIEVLTFQQKNTSSREKSILILSDGTKVTLNAQSSLKYPVQFKGKTREVYLVGEAFFSVHKNHAVPFIIHTNKLNVRVLGTEFNVRSYPGDLSTETTLIKGSIEVTLADRPSDRIILKPKEKLIVKNSSLYDGKPALKALNTTSNKAATQYSLTSLTYLNTKGQSEIVETSWLENKLVAQNEDFGELAKRMQRWYGVNIFFKKEGLKTARFTVTFEKENILQALEALKLTENFNYKLDNANVYIY